MSWLVKINGEEKSFEERDFSSARLKKLSLACDEFYLLSHKGDFAENGDLIELFYKGVRRFYGRLDSKKSIVSPSGESFEYSFKGPWRELSEIPYLQDWKSIDENNKECSMKKTRVVLGIDEEGKKINIGKQIEDIISCARLAGASISLGAHMANSEAPGEEISDLSCEEAILRNLRWAPDIVGYFDYSQTGVPRLFLMKRENLAQINLDKNFDFKKISHRLREDMRLESVCVIYEKTNTFNGQSTEVSVMDVFPKGAKIGGKKSLVMTVNLVGSKGSTQVQHIESEPIDTTSTGWWLKRFSFLDNKEIDNIIISNVNRESGLPRELTKGAVQDWMLKSAERDVISADISYNVNGVKVGSRKCSYKCTATDASAPKYYKNSYSSYEESVPTGVAESIYSAASEALVEGDAQIANASALELICKRISIPLRFENAVVVETMLDLFSENLHLKFGPPKHLYPADIVQLFRTARTRNSAVSSSRNSSLGASSGVLEIGGLESMEHSSDPFMFQSAIILNDPKNEKGKVILSVDDLEDTDVDYEVKLRKVFVVENGKVKQAYVPCGEAIDLT